MWKSTAFLMLLNRVAAVVLGLAVLIEVARNATLGETEVYVHVAESGVHVSLDDQTYWVQSCWEAPIVENLSPGDHVLKMDRDGDLLYKEDFHLQHGEQRILTAWNQRGTTPASRTQPTGG